MSEVISREWFDEAERQRSPSEHVEECAREALPSAGGYGGSETAGWKPVGSGAKAVRMVVGIVVGTLSFRLEG